MKIWLYFPLSVFELAFFSPNTGELCYKYLKRNIVLMPFSAKPFYNSKKKSRSVQTFQNICTRILTKKCKTIWKQDYRDGNLTRWISPEPERYEKILLYWLQKHKLWVNWTFVSAPHVVSGTDVGGRGARLEPSRHDCGRHIMNNSLRQTQLKITVWNTQPCNSISLFTSTGL